MPRDVSLLGPVRCQTCFDSNKQKCQ